MAKDKAIKNRIRVLRQRQKLTQGELAKLMDLDLTTVSRHEGGSRTLDDTLIRKYARVFKVETYELFVDPDDLPLVVTEPVGGPEVKPSLPLD